MCQAGFETAHRCFVRMAISSIREMQSLVVKFDSSNTCICKHQLRHAYNGRFYTCSFLHIYSNTHNFYPTPTHQQSFIIMHFNKEAQFNIKEEILNPYCRRVQVKEKRPLFCMFYESTRGRLVFVHGCEQCNMCCYVCNKTHSALLQVQHTYVPPLPENMVLMGALGPTERNTLSDCHSLTFITSSSHLSKSEIHNYKTLKLIKLVLILYRMVKSENCLAKCTLYT